MALMSFIYSFIFILYSLVLLYILFYNLIQFQLLLNYRKFKRNRDRVPSKCKELKDLPAVTVQLPIYNEKYVVGRLIDNICSLAYPKDKLQIQVLDDSTDDTLELSREKVNYYKEKGINVELIHRKDRKGYKAGALQNGMKGATGEFIAIFDADFLPSDDFLMRTLPCFRDPEIGVVQARWEHLNQQDSLLTRIQAFQLNVHFTIEQSARSLSDYLLQFNGTAGIWRKEAIINAGGWHADTLTEDLDLSYRAQLKGWRILYREDIGAPAELPAEIYSYKTQQYRWMKGGAETARKLMLPVWKSNISFWKKIHATAHLTASTVFLLIFSMAVLSVPMIWAIKQLEINMGFYLVFVLGVLAISWTFYQANVLNPYNQSGLSVGQKIIRFLFLFPVFMAISMGLSLHNSIAVIQGYRGKSSPFIRTPKLNVIDVTKEKQGVDKPGNKNQRNRIDKSIFLEGLMALYFVFGIVAGIRLENYSMLFLHILLAFGFGSIFYFSLRELKWR